YGYSLPFIAIQKQKEPQRLLRRQRRANTCYWFFYIRIFDLTQPTRRQVMKIGTYSLTRAT
ncbi:MAG: hypothetical protein ACI882_003288, partial [Reinekea sp.]